VTARDMTFKNNFGFILLWLNGVNKNTPFYYQL
jgi:hypothetical protein